MRSSAAKKETTAEPIKAKTVSVAELLKRHSDLTLRISFIESIVEMCTESFSYHDGLEPKNLVLTQDGRRVPSDVVDSILNEITKTMLKPAQDELRKISSIKVTNDN